MRAFTDQSQAPQRKAAGDLEKLKDDMVEEDFRLLMSHDWGRRILSWIIHDLCHVREMSWPRCMNIKEGGSAYAHAAYFEGIKHVGGRLELMAEAMAPHYADVMEAERRVRARQLEAVEQANQPGDPE